VTPAPPETAPAWTHTGYAQRLHFGPGRLASAPTVAANPKPVTEADARAILDAAF
jgi:hypothetical protein